MAKTKQKEPGYEWIKAIISEGNLRWRYQVKGLAVQGSDAFDEDVLGYTDDEIIALTCQMLGVTPKERKLIEVIWD